VTTGYFAGLTLGRIILIPVTNWLGNGNSIYILYVPILRYRTRLYILVKTLIISTILAMALELVIWFTDSIPGNAVCFALVGIFLGPCYPIVVMTVVDVIPPELQGGSIGWLASLGQGGSAIMPLYVHCPRLVLELTK
jgi:MFS family permease